MLLYLYSLIFILCGTPNFDNLDDLKNDRIDSLRHILETSRQSKYDELKSLEILAKEYENVYNAHEAAKIYEKAIKVCRSINDDKLLPNYLYMYAFMQTYNGSYKKAIPALTEAYQKGIKYGNKEIVARSLMQLGVISFFEKNWDLSLHYYKKALEIAEEIKNTKGISLAYNNIANVYQKRDDYNKAIKFYEKALNIQQIAKDSSSMCNCMMNLGSCYGKLDDTANSLKYLGKSLRIAKRIGDLEIKSLCYMNLGITYHRKGFFDHSIKMLKFGEEVARNAGYIQVLREITQTLASILAEQKKYKEAFEYLTEYKRINDSIIDKATAEKAKEFETKYKTKEKEIELEIQTKNLEIAKLTYVFLAIISLLLLAVVGHLIYNNKKKRRYNLRLRELNSTKDKLFSIISHDLKSPAIAQKMSLDALISNIDTLDNQDLRKYLEELRNSSDSQINLLQNLLKWANIQTGKIKCNIINFDICEVISNVTELYRVHLNNKSIGMNLDISKNCFVEADKQMISTVLRNLLSNAIKFTNIGGEIKISVKPYNDKHRISIADNGVGMTEEQIENILKVGTMKSQIGTNGEIGTGLGIIICEELLNINKSKLEIKSEKNKGCIISFII